MSTAANPVKADTRIIVFGIPDDQHYLAALGTVAVRHAQMDHMLRMMVKTLAEVSYDEAMNATEYQGSHRLRERIERLAKSRLGESQALVKLQSLMRRCERATMKRNDLVHGVIAKEFNKEGELMHVSSQGLRTIPPISQIHSLASELVQLSNELNTARLQGFLAEALANPKKSKRSQGTKAGSDME